MGYNSVLIQSLIVEKISIFNLSLSKFSNFTEKKTILFLKFQFLLETSWRPSNNPKFFSARFATSNRNLFNFRILVTFRFCLDQNIFSRFVETEFFNIDRLVRTHYRLDVSCNFIFVTRKFTACRVFCLLAGFSKK